MNFNVVKFFKETLLNILFLVFVYGTQIIWIAIVARIFKTAFPPDFQSKVQWFWDGCVNAFRFAGQVLGFVLALGGLGACGIAASVGGGLFTVLIGIGVFFLFRKGIKKRPMWKEEGEEESV